MISVVIPVYNVGRYIAACISSLINQTYSDFEILIVNDGTPDRSADIAESMLAKQDRIDYRVITTENCGVSSARNTGLNNIRGEYVVMVDADDVLSAAFLEDFHQMTVESPQSDIFSCGFSVVDEDKSNIFKTEKSDVISFTYEEAQVCFFNRTVKFLLPALMFRSSFLRKNHIFFDEQVKYSEDVQFIWRCLAYNRKNMVHLYKKNYNYILHEGSTMTSSSIDKILTLCSGLDRLKEETGDLFCEPVKSQLEMRMYFSMLHGAARMLSFEDFKILYKKGDCKPYIKMQARTGKVTPRAVAWMLLVSRRLGYEIMKRV